MSDSNVQTVQRFSFTHEDVFNYLYGYLPIQLVHPAQLQREKQSEDEEARVPCKSYSHSQFILMKEFIAQNH